MKKIYFYLYFLCGIGTSMLATNNCSAQLANVNAFACFGYSANVAAIGTGPINWYDSASGGQLLHTGQLFTTPAIKANTSYWYSANNGPRVQVTVALLNSGVVMAKANPATVVEGASSNLAATTTSGSVQWFLAPQGNISLIDSTPSGGTLTVTPLDTTLYYAQASGWQGTSPVTVNFSFTGKAQSFTVPAGVTSIKVDAAGAAGGNAYEGLTSGNTGGKGGRVQATMSVTPGQVLYFYVGGRGHGGVNNCSSCADPAPGWNGGGGGLNATDNAGTGGGATDIRVGGQALANRVLVAGGGGGAGYGIGGCAGGAGGAGGGLTGGDGVAIACLADQAQNGKGGTQAAGGAGGCVYGNSCGTGGSLGAGGNAGSYSGNFGGAGGGGYYGGGGATDDGGGGGGGSYTNDSLFTGAVHTQGYAPSDGYITITYMAPACYPYRLPVIVNVTTPVGAVGYQADENKLAIATGTMQVALSPNPAMDVANLQIAGSKGDVAVKVTDLAGKVVLVLQHTGFVNGNVALPVSNLASGLYIVTVQDKLSKTSIKMVKK